MKWLQTMGLALTGAGVRGALVLQEMMQGDPPQAFEVHVGGVEFLFERSKTGWAMGGVVLLPGGAGEEPLAVCQTIPSDEAAVALAVRLSLVRLMARAYAAVARGPRANDGGEVATLAAFRALDAAVGHNPVPAPAAPPDPRVEELQLQLAQRTAEVKRLTEMLKVLEAELDLLRQGRVP